MTAIYVLTYSSVPKSPDPVNAIVNEGYNIIAPTPRARTKFFPKVRRKVRLPNRRSLHLAQEESPTRRPSMRHDSAINHIRVPIRALITLLPIVDRPFLIDIGIGLAPVSRPKKRLAKLPGRRWFKASSRQEACCGWPYQIESRTIFDKLRAISLH